MEQDDNVVGVPGQETRVDKDDPEAEVRKKDDAVGIR